jgi:hypothetical protein
MKKKSTPKAVDSKSKVDDGIALLKKMATDQFNAKAAEFEGNITGRDYKRWLPIKERFLTASENGDEAEILEIGKFVQEMQAKEVLANLEKLIKGV